MNNHHRPWGTALMTYALYRRTLAAVGGRRRSPQRTRLRRLILLMLFMFVMPVAGPIFWHALLTMPPALVFLIVSVTVIRVVRWYWRRQP